MKRITVELEFQEPILGTSPGSPLLAEQFTAGGAPDETLIEEEVEAIERVGVDDRGKTVFPRDNEGTPIFWDYQIKGFFKDACAMLKKADAKESSKIKAHKKIIDGLIFIKERQIPIIFDGEIGTCERPLRASTPQGERVALAFSEEIPAGATITFTILALKNDLIPAVKEWLNYGELRGLGQWRNSGKGRFTYRVIDPVEEIVC